MAPLAPKTAALAGMGGSMLSYGARCLGVATSNIGYDGVGDFSGHA